MENSELLQAISEIMDQKLKPIQQDVSSMKSDISGMESDISSLKDGQKSLQEQVTKANITLENDVSKKLSALFDAHQLDSEKIEQIHETVESLNDAYAGTDVLTRVNTAEIKKLKTKIG